MTLAPWVPGWRADETPGPRAVVGQIPSRSRGRKVRRCTLSGGRDDLVAGNDEQQIAQLCGGRLLLVGPAGQTRVAYQDKQLRQ